MNEPVHRNRIRVQLSLDPERLGNEENPAPATYHFRARAEEHGSLSRFFENTIADSYVKDIRIEELRKVLRRIEEDTQLPQSIRETAKDALFADQVVEQSVKSLRAEARNKENVARGTRLNQSRKVRK